MAKQPNDELGADAFGADDFDFGDEDKRSVVIRKKEEMSETLKKFKAQKAEEQKTFYENVDSEYWIAICFQSRDQKEAFLEKAGLMQYGDKYLDGMDVAEHMGINIKEMTPKMRKTKISKEWLEFT
jgi:hypothetical protein